MNRDTTESDDLQENAPENAIQTEDYMDIQDHPFAVQSNGNINDSLLGYCLEKIYSISRYLMSYTHSDIDMSNHIDTHPFYI
jgi:hypothetical protein